MKCDDARSVVASWQRAGSLETEDFSGLVEHLAECEACRTRYRLILPLINRDMGGTAAETRTQADETFTRGVMERVRGTARRFPQRFSRPPLRRLLPAAAAAAVLLLAAGLVIRGFLPAGRPTEVTVHFVLDAPGARAVSLVGSFNGWNPDSLPLKRAPGSQEWKISVKLKRGDTYLYNFIVNGTTWIPDPTTDLKVEDGFGGESSLIQL